MNKKMTVEEFFTTYNLGFRVEISDEYVSLWHNWFKEKDDESDEENEITLKKSLSLPEAIKLICLHFHASGRWWGAFALAEKVIPGVSKVSGPTNEFIHNKVCELHYDFKM